jgi:ribosomal-protein-alanine N-acetyltransferase
MQVLKGRTVIGMVAADEEENVVGFMIYELRTRGIYLIDVAVAKAHRRRGVGRAMMDKLIAKLDARRPRLCVSVDEYSLDAQLFFRSMGFRFKKILHGFYGESDAYLMEVDSERQANQAV